MNGKATAGALLQACQAHGPRFTALFNEGARKLPQGDSGRVVGVQTERRRWAGGAYADCCSCRVAAVSTAKLGGWKGNISACPAQANRLGVPKGGPLKPMPALLPSHHCSIHAGRGVVVALGAWSGAFLADQMADVRWAAAFRPRRGLLLEMPRPGSMPPVQHGMMEVGYMQV